MAGGAGRRYLGPVDLGADPLAQIVVAVRADRAGDPDWVGAQAARMMSDPGHLARLVDEPGGPPVMLMVDRFEQIFTPGGRGLAERFGLGRARRQVEAFAANLAELTRPGAGHTVILAVRRGDAVRVRGLAPLKDLLERGLIRVIPPGEKELREMIEGPAATVGLKFEKGVIDQLVRDVQSDPWALPLLQYALVLLWGRRERDLVTWKAYHRLGNGGARQALANGAEAMFRNDPVDPEALSDAEKAIAERVFKRLVRPGPGRDVVLERLTLGELAAPAPGPGPTGRIERIVRSFRDQVLTPPGAGDATPPGPEPPSTAAGEGEPPAAVGAVVRRLARVGLVRESGGAGEASIELASEALADRWRRLAEWVQDERNEDVRGLTAGRSRRDA